MKKLTKDYFGDSVLLIGYSSNEKSFSRMVCQEMEKNGIEVHAVNGVSEGPFDRKVYRKLNEIPDLPDTACVLIGKANVLEAVRELESVGVKRILVQSKGYVDHDLEEFCEAKGLELTTGCAFMAIGKGLHRFHGFLAGVK